MRIRPPRNPTPNSNSSSFESTSPFAPSQFEIKNRATQTPETKLEPSSCEPEPLFQLQAAVAVEILRSLEHHTLRIIFAAQTPCKDDELTVVVEIVGSLRHPRLGISLAPKTKHDTPWRLDASLTPVRRASHNHGPRHFYWITCGSNERTKKSDT